MQVFNRSGYHVADISITLTDDGPRYTVVEWEYGTRRKPRFYLTLEKAVEMTERRFR